VTDRDELDESTENSKAATAAEMRRGRSGVGQQDVRDELDVDEGGLEHREDL
jgi:hypothetical protein